VRTRNFASSKREVKAKFAKRRKRESTSNESTLIKPFKKRALGCLDHRGFLVDKDGDVIMVDAVELSSQSIRYDSDGDVIMELCEPIEMAAPTQSLSFVAIKQGEQEYIGESEDCDPSYRVSDSEDESDASEGRWQSTRPGQSRDRSFKSDVESASSPDDSSSDGEGSAQARRSNRKLDRPPGNGPAKPFIHPDRLAMIKRYNSRSEEGIERAFAPRVAVYGPPKPMIHPDRLAMINRARN
jgi:hypothetical protein